MIEAILADYTDSKGIAAQVPSIKDIKTSIDHDSAQLGAMANAQSAREPTKIIKWLSTHDHDLLYRQASQRYCEKTCFLGLGRSFVQDMARVDAHIAMALRTGRFWQNHAHNFRDAAPLAEWEFCW